MTLRKALDGSAELFLTVVLTAILNGATAPEQAALAAPVVAAANTVCVLSPNRDGVFHHTGSGQTWAHIGSQAKTIHNGPWALVATKPQASNLVCYNGSATTAQSIGATSGGQGTPSRWPPAPFTVSILNEAGCSDTSAPPTAGFNRRASVLDRPLPVK